MTEMILIVRLIASLNTTTIIKKKITACTLYGVQVSDGIDLKKRYKRCRDKYLEKR